MKTRTKFENAGMTAIGIGTGIMLLALAVAYFGGAMAPSPQLVDRTALGWTMVLMFVGVAFNLCGLARLNMVEPSERTRYYREPTAGESQRRMRPMTR